MLVKGQKVRSLSTGREYVVSQDESPTGRFAFRAESKGLEFDSWTNADGFELVQAEEEEDFYDDLVKVDVEVGPDEDDEWDDCVVPTTIFERRESALELGNRIHAEMEKELMNRPAPNPKVYAAGEVSISVGGREFVGGFQDMLFDSRSDSIVEATFVGRPAIPPPAPKRKDWRMFYDNSSQRRKDQPVTEGFLKYCPAAIRLAAEVSRLGNEKHNPGEKMHHARDKSGDHLDCAGRHLLDADEVDGDLGIIEAVNAFWRLGMYIQEKCEREYGWPKAPNARGEAKR